MCAFIHVCCSASDGLFRILVADMYRVTSEVPSQCRSVWLPINVAEYLLHSVELHRITTKHGAPNRF